MADFWVRFSRILKHPSLPNLYPIKPDEGVNPVQISMPITIENMNATKEDANNFFDIVSENLAKKGVVIRRVW